MKKTIDCGSDKMEKEEDIVTISDLIEFLEKNFDKDDKLAFFDEGGAWCELVRTPKSLIGDVRWMFNYVKDKKEHELKEAENIGNYANRLKYHINENFKDVKEDDVVIL